MTTDISRRRIVQGIGAVAAGVTLPGLIGPALAQAAALRVTHFGGPYKPLEGILTAPFEAATKGTLEWSVETSVSALSKMQAAPDSPPFDVTLMSRSFGMRAAKAGLLRTIEPAKIPNLKETIDGTLTPGGSGVAMFFDSVDLMVNTDIYKGQIKSWMDLWNPDLKGKLIMPSSAISTSLYVLICVVRAMGGKEENDKDIDNAFRKLAELKPNVRTFFSDPIQPNQILERGEAGVAPQFVIRVFAASKVNPKVVRMSAKEGQVAIGYDWVITKGAKNPDLAHRFIDSTLAQAQQARATEAQYGTPVRRNLAVPGAAKASGASDGGKLFFIDEDFVAEKQRGWLQRWAREVQG